MSDERKENIRAAPSRPTVSTMEPDGSIVELLYDPDSKTTAFAVWRGGQASIERAITVQTGVRLMPYAPENNLIRNEAVLLPSEPAEYQSDAALIADIEAFIHRYVDLSPTFEKVASYYVLFTWLHDAFNELPYLRLRGDFGTGKTRALLVIGSLCYKAFFASGASTVSPIFHTLDAFRGTLVFDEADFRFSDEKSDLVKILNNGNAKGLPVLRNIMNHRREYNPRAFHVFGPKVVAMRGSYHDRALESRFLTEETGTRKLRADIPINLPDHYKDEARALRNKLLLYRFRHRLTAKLDPSLVDPRIEPRLNQILVPLLSIVDDPALRCELRAVAGAYHQALLAERGLSAAAQVLEILVELAGEREGNIAVGDIVARFTERHGDDYERRITGKWIGRVLRENLKLATYKTTGVYVVPAPERAKLAHLCERYGLLPESLGETLDVGT